mmetsp:Transcript_14824/g.21656  ORF Transcript_14824/g.21656 Transcript_14824/m.21656 type:complete len:155 (+) Transcript_14824:790-1254(+)
MAAQLSGISTKSNDVQFSKVPLKIVSPSILVAFKGTLTNVNNEQCAKIDFTSTGRCSGSFAPINFEHFRNTPSSSSVFSDEKSLFLNSRIDKRRSLRCKEDSLRNPVFSKTCKIEMLLHLFLLETLGQLFSSVVNIHKMLQTQSQGAPLVDLRR